MLVVKTQANGEFPEFQSQALQASSNRADILFLRQELSRADADTLIASCDLILSPHRSEGFGLALAEAFMLNRPVLATGWSGNMDFMDGLDDALIPYTFVPVHDPFGVYANAEQNWAEPDLEDAAIKLRAFAESPILRAKVAEAGRERVEKQVAAWGSEANVTQMLRSKISHPGRT